MDGNKDQRVIVSPPSALVLDSKALPSSSKIVTNTQQKALKGQKVLPWRGWVLFKVSQD